MRHIRIHGRGGEGVKLASRIVSRAAFLAGRVVQDSPLYGAERRGAPVVAFVRVSDGSILERGYIERPDVIVVLDCSLLDHTDAGVLDGADGHALVLANAAEAADELARAHGIAGRVAVIDVSAIALDILGKHLLSAPMAGFTVKSAGLASWQELERALAIELGEIGLTGPESARNIEATRQVFDRAPAPGMPVPAAPEPRAATPTLPYVLPHLPIRASAPTIDAGATSALRNLEGWRVYRPVIDLAGCTRCCLCFALCPEGAIHLDAESYPRVDYAACKGCMVCAAECPPRVIDKVREEAHGG